MHYLNIVFNFTKKIILIALITFSFTLFIDFFFGKKILSLTDKFWRSTNFYDRLLRVDHDIYHHTLRPNITYNLAQGFDGYFKLCTDNNGFRYKCNPIARGKDFDYAFIGDSFTEGVSLNYEPEICNRHAKRKQAACYQGGSQQGVLFNSESELEDRLPKRKQAASCQTGPPTRSIIKSLSET